MIEVLDLRSLNRALLARQMLLQRVELPAAEARRLAELLSAAGPLEWGVLPQ